MKYIIGFIFLICCGSSFAQEFGSPDSKWVYNLNGYKGYVLVEFESDSLINSMRFNKFLMKTTQLRQQDTVTISRPLFLRNDDGLVYYSTNGSEIDTLYDFKAAPGDTWVMNSTYDILRRDYVYNIVDTFNVDFAGVRLKALSYTLHISGEFMNPHVDTIYEYFGSNLVFILPHDHFKENPGGNIGGTPICFYNDTLGNINITSSLNLGSLYPIDCDNLSSIVDVSASVGRLHLRPNPVVDYLYLNDMEIGTRYSVTTLDGHIRLRGTYNGKVDVTPLRSGIYFLIVDGVVEKFIKH